MEKGALICPWCDKSCITLCGFSQHENKCPVKQGSTPQKCRIPRWEDHPTPTRYNDPYKPDVPGTVRSHDCPECYGDVPSSMDANIGDVDDSSLDTSTEN